MANQCLEFAGWHLTLRASKDFPVVQPDGKPLALFSMQLLDSFKYWLAVSRLFGKNANSWDENIHKSDHPRCQ